MNRTRKLKRKLKTNSQYATVPTWNKVVKIQINTEPQRNSSISTNEFNSDKLLELCIRRILTNIWYRILPNSSFECEDLSFVICRSWDTISPLLTKLGYIKNYGKEFRINQIKFENLQHVIPGIDQCHTSFHHTKGGSRQLFICVGKPHYSGPTKQINATKDNKFAHK